MIAPRPSAESTWRTEYRSPAAAADSTLVMPSVKL